MACCSGYGTCAASEQFGPSVAARDLKRYRRRGPDAASRLLLEAVAPQLERGDLALDIGGGVGVLAFELLARGARTATLVDGSPAYLQAAESEIERRDMRDRMHCVSGDFVAAAKSVAPADVVVMHRVVCCYPEYGPLLSAAADHSRRVLAFSYPRRRWIIRSWVTLYNAFRRMRGLTFQAFVHSPDAMTAIASGKGFRRVQHAQTAIWSIDVYTRVQGIDAPPA